LIAVFFGVLVDVVALEAKSSVRKVINGGRVDLGIATVAQIIPAQVVRLQERAAEGKVKSVRRRRTEMKAEGKSDGRRREGVSVCVCVLSP
jgi:hypothetical protein